MNNTVENLMERGFSELTPDCFDQIMAKIAETPQQSEVKAEESNNRTYTYERVRVRRKSVMASFATAAVAVICLVSLRYYDAVKVTDEIYIDVNPSIVLELNSKGKVVRTEGRNGDGDYVVGASAEQLKGVKEPAEAVTVLMDEMNSEDYFHESKGTVLISWYTESSEKEAAPLDEVCDAVDTYAADNELELTVYKQSIEKSDEIDQEAEEAGMPVARYAYYKKLSDEHKVSLEKIKDKNLDEVKEYMDDLEDKKSEKTEKTDTQTPVEETAPAVTEESQAKKKDPNTSEEEKPQKKDNTSSSEEEKPKKEDTTSQDDNTSSEETSSGDESTSSEEASSSSSGEETSSGSEGSHSKKKDTGSEHSATEESGESTSE